MSEEENDETLNNVTKRDSSKNKSEENSYLDKVYNLYNKVDTSIDSGLEKTDSIITDLNKLFTGFFKFLKKSLEVKQIKKVLFFLFMSVAMAFIFVGINVFFGKIIL